MNAAYTLTPQGESRGYFAGRFRVARVWVKWAEAGFSSQEGGVTRLEVEDAMAKRLELRQPGVHAGQGVIELLAQRRALRLLRTFEIDRDNHPDLF